MKTLSSDCQLCKTQFEQDTKRGRPFRFCETCRKLLWYEKRAAALKFKEDGNEEKV